MQWCSLMMSIFSALVACAKDLRETDRHKMLDALSACPQPRCNWSDLDFIHINQPNIISCVICSADLNHVKIMTRICLRSCMNVFFFFCLLWNTVSAGRFWFVKYCYNGWPFIKKTDAVCALHTRAWVQRTGSMLFTFRASCETLWCIRSLPALPPVRQYFYTDLHQIRTGVCTSNTSKSSHFPRRLVLLFTLPHFAQVHAENCCFPLVFEMFMPAWSINLALEGGTLVSFSPTVRKSS